jgi:hypothetical protein
MKGQSGKGDDNGDVGGRRGAPFLASFARSGEFARRERPSHSDRSRSECDGGAESLP